MRMSFVKGEPSLLTNSGAGFTWVSLIPLRFKYLTMAQKGHTTVPEQPSTKVKPFGWVFVLLIVRITAEVGLEVNTKSHTLGYKKPIAI